MPRWSAAAGVGAVSFRLIMRVYTAKSFCRIVELCPPEGRGAAPSRGPGRGTLPGTPGGAATTVAWWDPATARPLCPYPWPPLRTPGPRDVVTARGALGPSQARPGAGCARAPSGPPHPRPSRREGGVARRPAPPSLPARSSGFPPTPPSGFREANLCVCECVWKGARGVGRIMLAPVAPHSPEEEGEGLGPRT